MRCEDVVDVLPGLAGDDVRPGRRTRSHLTRCLRCQAELARYRRLHRACRRLGSDDPAPPPGLDETVLAYVDHSPLPPARRTRHAVAVGSVAATAAAGAAGLVVLTRRRQS